MQRSLLGSAVLIAGFFVVFVGCGPAEVQPAPESIPNIPPPRGAEASPAAGGSAAAAPTGRTPAKP